MGRKGLLRTPVPSVREPNVIIQIHEESIILALGKKHIEPVGRLRADAEANHLASVAVWPT